MRQSIIHFFSVSTLVLNFSLCLYGTSPGPPGDPASADQISEEDRRRMIGFLSQSEQYYTMGIDSYDRGESEEARKYFKKALKILASSHIDHNLFYGLSDYFDRIYRELNNRLTLLEASPFPHSSILPVPIEHNNPTVQKYLTAFSRAPMRSSIIRAFERMGLYKDMVSEILDEYGLPQELIYLPIVESRYAIHDVSWAGAVGLWQFMKHTGRGYGMRVNFWIDERRDPEKSTRAAARYLRNLYFWFNDWHLALAAYNRGEHGIERDLAFSKTTNFNHLAQRNAIPNETEKYVPQLMAIVIIARNPEKYGLEFEYHEPLSYDVYETDVMIDLEVAARCAGITVKELKKLNPAITAWCTPKNYPDFQLKIPHGSKVRFLEELALVDNLCPAREFIRYKVKKGDVLGRIAQKYRTSVRAIMRDNKIKNPRLLMPGKRLVIKPGKKYYNK